MGRPRKEEIAKPTLEPEGPPSVEEFHDLKHQEQLDAIYALLLKLVNK